MGVEVEFRDINRQPPPREFLEKHVEPDRLPDFFSRRSPALKGRGLPSSKKEAIDLMLAEPNLIRRPVLVKGSRVVFGFDQAAYRSLFG